MLEDVFRRYLAGEVSAPVAAMQLLLEENEPGHAAAVVAATGDDRLAPLAALLDGCDGIARTITTLRGNDALGAAGDPAAVIDRNRKLFDWLVDQSPEASVALYSLGRPELLDEATAEIVTALDGWGLLGRERRVLDLGCGIGRVAAAIAPRVRQVTGIDISAAMIAEARRRCAEFGNVELRECGGIGFDGVTDGSQDLVLGVDSFPYLVEAGSNVVGGYFAEARRVLAPYGDLVILNYSYSGTLAQDIADVAALADAHGFDVLRLGERPFRLWDGIAFHLRCGS